ncbi:Ldh family oxidoreductase [Nocardioides humi]|uniref:Ldh family oxidoreductase n=1 Tax=Nocardioides humi TaxID=449461 RepID=A0ABN2A7U5_9ACTN|nr:Ldh family oxidoreductase [Nocardioides humi]
MRLRHDVLEGFLGELYQAYGVSREEAEIVARSQVESNLVGHDSHGVIKTADYLARIEKGHIVPGAPFEVETEGPTTAVVNGNWGFGFVVTDRAMRMAIEKARATGVAGVTIRHQGHVGRLGAYTAMAAEAGLIAVMTADSGLGPKSVTPFGGRERRLGTNPISIAVPSGQSGVVCIDMATAAVASGKLQVAKARGEQVPAGWIVDSEGRGTTDPNAFYEGGALLPVGADQGHKGYGLSFMVEVLSGLLTGLGFGIDPQGRHNDGCFIALFDVERFRPLADLAADVDAFIDFLKATEPAEGFTEILYPGELEERRRRAGSLDGLEIDERTWDELARLAADKGVALPAEVSA